MNEEEFRECIEMMAKGNIEGLRKIYDAYDVFVYSMCLGILKNEEAAEDVTANFFIKFYRAAGRIHTEDMEHKVWLTGRIRKQCINYIKKYNQENLDDDDSDEEEMDSRSKGQNAAKMEGKPAYYALVKEAKKTLKPKEREILDMKLLGDFTEKEIAKAEKMPLDSVSWMYKEGIEKVRRCLVNGRQ